MNKNDKVAVLFQVDKDVKETLLEHCRDKGMTLSGLIRMLLKQYADEQKLG